MSPNLKFRAAHKSRFGTRKHWSLPHRLLGGVYYCLTLGIIQQGLVILFIYIFWFMNVRLCRSGLFHLPNPPRVPNPPLIRYKILIRGGVCYAVPPEEKNFQIFAAKTVGNQSKTSRKSSQKALKTLFLTAFQVYKCKNFRLRRAIHSYEHQNTLFLARRRRKIFGGLGPHTKPPRIPNPPLLGTRF